MSRQPVLALTMGDPSGIGPEIVARAVAESDQSLTVLGTRLVMERACALVASDLPIQTISSPNEAKAGRLNLIETSRFGEDSPLSFLYGHVTQEAGAAALESILAGVQLSMSGKIDGLVTAPVHKEALVAAGCRHLGHTELLAEKSGVDHVTMMLANRELRVVLVTVHCPLSEAICSLTLESELATIRKANAACQTLGIAHPRIAVAGLNPHAGENGLLGHEDAKIITPAIQTAQAEGLNVSGPLSGDTVFMHARQGRYDIVVAQYHDQGLIPIKYLGIAGGVNVTLGLPFVRTSPDHGTAFDIAGQGIADSEGLKLAIEMANKLAGPSLGVS